MVIATTATLAACAPYAAPGATPPPPASATPTRVATPDASPSAPPSNAPTPTSAPSPTDVPTPTVPPAEDPGSAEIAIITADMTDTGLEVTGIVVGQTDPAAVCVITATSGSRTRTAEVTANPSGDNSYCPVLRIARSDLAAGTWDLVLSYRSSAGVTGRSSSTAVEVQ